MWNKELPAIYQWPPSWCIHKMTKNVAAAERPSRRMMRTMCEHSPTKCGFAVDISSAFLLLWPALHAAAGCATRRSGDVC